MAGDEALPRVSVLIISKDRRPLLFDLLRSIKELDYPKEKLEVVVVEDTRDPLPPPDVVYVSGSIKGFGYARQVSLQVSTAEIVAFTDDDCLVDPAWLRELVTPLVLDQGIGGVAGAVLPRDSSLLGHCEQALGYPGGGLRYVHAAGGRVVEAHTLNTANCVYRRQVIREAGGFNAGAVRGGEDYLLARAVTKRHRCLFNPRAIVYHASRGSLRRLFARFVKFGRAQVDLLGLVEERLPLVRHMARESLALKYFGVLAVVLGLGLHPSWLLAVVAAQYGALAFSHRFVTRYVADRRVPWAAPVVRFVADFGMDCGRVWGLGARIFGRGRR